MCLRPWLSASPVSFADRASPSLWPTRPWRAFGAVRRNRSEPGCVGCRREGAPQRHHGENRERHWVSLIGTYMGYALFGRRRSLCGVAPVRCH